MTFISPQLCSFVFKEYSLITMDDFKELHNLEKPVLIDFYADWCGPCQTMEQVIVDIKEHYGKKLDVLKINVDDHPEVVRKYKIQSVPTFLLFKNGEICWRSAGIQSRSDLKSAINNAVVL